MSFSPEVEAFRSLCQRQPMLPEEIIQGFYRAVLAPADTAIDCGAHTGYHTRPLVAHCSTGMVVAYEGLPHLAEKLSSRHQNDDNLVVRHCAIQDDPGLTSTSFQYVPDRPGRSGIRSATINTEPGNAYDFEEIVVPATTIDKDLEELGIPHSAVRFIKLDLEGGEFRALRGARQVLEFGRPLLAAENGFYATKVGGYTSVDMQQLFDEHGYVRITMFGEPFVGENFDFWYVFAAPSEHVEMAVNLVNGLREAALYRFGRQPTVS